MARKSTTVYTMALMVLVEFEENISFKTMHEMAEVLQQTIKDSHRLVCVGPTPMPVDSITIDKVIIQKKVTY